MVQQSPCPYRTSSGGALFGPQLQWLLAHIVEHGQHDHVVRPRLAAGGLLAAGFYGTFILGLLY